ncbi:MAG: GNAT family N-acetyltransferase [Bellilinea sp.]
MAIKIREFTPADSLLALTLWKSSEGIGLSAADEPERIAGYLTRNPGMSYTAWDGESLVGAVLCGHDGRRGYLHHLAVDRAYRGQGIGRALVDRCHAALQALGIEKVHIFVYRDNEAALAFWKGVHYVQRDTLELLSATLIE